MCMSAKCKKSRSGPEKKGSALRGILLYFACFVLATAVLFPCFDCIWHLITRTDFVFSWTRTLLACLFSGVISLPIWFVNHGVSVSGDPFRSDDDPKGKEE